MSSDNQTIVDFIAEITKETVNLGNFPGSDEYKPPVRYNEAIRYAWRFAQYVGAFILVSHDDYQYGTAYQIFVIDEELRTLKSVVVLEFSDTFKKYLRGETVERQGVEYSINTHKVTGTIPDTVLQIGESQILSIDETKASEGQSAFYRFNLELTRRGDNYDFSSQKYSFYAFKDRDLAKEEEHNRTQSRRLYGATSNGVYIDGESRYERITKATDFAALKAKAIQEYNQRMQREEETEAQTGGS